MNKLAKESEEFQREMRKTAFPDPAPAPSHSDSALETTPQVRKLSQELQTKAVSSKTGNQLEQVREARLYAGSSHVELEKPSKAPHEWVESPLPSAKPATPTIVREQSHKTILIREPPNGRSLSSDKLSNKAVCPSQAFIHSSSLRVIPQGGNVL